MGERKCYSFGCRRSSIRASDTSWSPPRRSTASISGERSWMRTLRSLTPNCQRGAPGNCVFQIRTGIYPLKAILELDNTWDVLGISETGQHIFWQIQAEIERDPNIKHGIITYDHAIEQLQDIAKNENVCFLTPVFEGKRDWKPLFKKHRLSGSLACRK